jgi:hypothetical protein
MTQPVPDAAEHARLVAEQERLERALVLQNEVITSLRGDVVRLQQTAEELGTIVRALGVTVRGAS